MRHAIASFLLVAVANSAFAVDAAERKFVHEGMDEGEVLFKIGRPDQESVVRGDQSRAPEKKWIYFPVSRDEQTLTIVTIRNGKVGGVERKIAR